MSKRPFIFFCVKAKSDQNQVERGIPFNKTGQGMARVKLVSGFKALLSLFFSLSNLANHGCTIVQIFCSSYPLLMLLRKLLLSIMGNCWRPPRLV